MKNFDDLTDEEVLALSDDDVQRYIDRECAEAGIPLLDHPGPKPDDSPLAGDLKTFEVSGVFFTDKMEAMEICDAINKCASRVSIGYVSGPSYQKKAAPADANVAITETMVLSEAAANNRAAAIAAAERRKKDYEARLVAFNNAGYSRNRIADEITGRVEAVAGKERLKADVRRQHEKYLELAEGNRRTAARFLLAAIKNARELCPELFTFTNNDPADYPLSSKRHYVPDEGPTPSPDEDMPL